MLNKDGEFSESIDFVFNTNCFSLGAYTYMYIYKEGWLNLFIHIMVKCVNC